MPAPGRQPGFTLVELLVVISIVSMLVALLLPSLGNAKEAGRRVVCLSNAKQLTLASITMGEDHHGWIDGVDASAAADGTAVVPAWPKIVSSYMSTGLDFQGYNVTIMNGCPDIDPPGSASAFAGNSAFIGQQYLPLHSLYEVKHTPRIYLVGECFFWCPGYPSTFNTTNDGSWASGVYTHARHRAEGLDFCYVDGHGGFLSARGDDASAPWWTIGGAVDWWPYNAWGTGMLGE